MPDYYVTPLDISQPAVSRQVMQLLDAEGLRLDAHIDYTCGIYGETGGLIATGSCFGNTLRCFAVSSTHRGMGLLELLVTHLTAVQFARGNSHLFLYTKPQTAAFFSGLGYSEIARVTDHMVFMENCRNGFSSYLASLEAPKAPAKTSAAIVLNANPFTLGHLHLISRAAAENDVVHLFIVSEDASLIPASVRKDLVLAGTTQFSNLLYHDTASYLISRATFPGYFQKDTLSAVRGQALLDAGIFCRIADRLGIQTRYVGDEPFSQVTRIYNEILTVELPAHGIKCVELPRLTYQGHPISASSVRLAIQQENRALLRALVPESTYRYLLSNAASPVIAAIRRSDSVTHD